MYAKNVALTKVDTDVEADTQLQFLWGVDWVRIFVKNYKSGMDNLYIVVLGLK